MRSSPRMTADVQHKADRAIDAMRVLAEGYFSWFGSNKARIEVLCVDWLAWQTQWRQRARVRLRHWQAQLIHHYPRPHSTAVFEDWLPTECRGCSGNWSSHHTSAWSFISHRLSSSGSTHHTSPWSFISHRLSSSGSTWQADNEGESYSLCLVHQRSVGACRGSGVRASHTHISSTFLQYPTPGWHVGRSL